MCPKKLMRGIVKRTTLGSLAGRPNITLGPEVVLPNLDARLLQELASSEVFLVCTTVPKPK